MAEVITALMSLAIGPLASQTEDDFGASFGAKAGAWPEQWIMHRFGLVDHEVYPASRRMSATNGAARPSNRWSLSA